MSENTTEIRGSAEQSSVTPFPVSRPAPQVAFDRQELQIIMGLYGRMVAAGEWRDYAMDFLRDKAVFSIFRRTSEIPLYRIVKDPELRQRQGMYAVMAHGGLILKRGQDLAQVVRVIDKPVRTVTM
ncbi:MAG: DUF2794 domain-containing protein [Beijerinckiaceae bacterium]